MTTRRITFLLLCTVALGAAGSNMSMAATSEPSSGQAARAAEARAATAVARIVFVGKERACDCTRRSIEAGWAALQKALGTPPKVPVERLSIDTDSAKVAPYREQKPMMALPAIYFLNSKSAVVELLQGEITADEIGKVLAR